MLYTFQIKENGLHFYLGNKNTIFFSFLPVGPKNTSVSVSPSAEVDVGLNITLICRTHANPTAQNYTWYKIGDSDDVAGNGPELSFIGISPRDGGEYLCSVINKHGRQNSSAVTVRVKGRSVNKFILYKIMITCLLFTKVNNPF